MKKIRSIDEIPNLDKRILLPIQMLPVDFVKLKAIDWNPDNPTGDFPSDVLLALQANFDFADLKGFLAEGSFFVYDWPWQGKTFEQRYQRLEDKTGAFLRTNGAIVLINAEHIRLSDLAARKDTEAFIWDMSPDSEPYLLKQR